MNHVLFIKRMCKNQYFGKMEFDALNYLYLQYDIQKLHLKEFRHISQKYL